MVELTAISLKLLLGYTTPPWAVLIAGTFVVSTVSLSLYLVFEHLSAYKNPEEQKFLIGVLLMVPCYSIESFVSLMRPGISVDMEILRDCYEAFAMYCFGRYLVACLGGEERTIEFMEREGRTAHKTPLLEHGSEKGVVKHHFPMSLFLKPWVLGQWFYQVIKIGIVQYMLIKALTAITAVILESYDVYCDGDFKLNCGYPYMAVILNFSQSWALYCLVQFYSVTKDELAHIQPLAKFLTFKSIVFLTWWQGVAIAILYAIGLFKSPIAQALQFKSSVQDFIICIEMGVASIVHLYVFAAKPYELMGDRFPGTVAVLGDKNFYPNINRECVLDLSIMLWPKSYSRRPGRIGRSRRYYVSVDCPIDPDEVRDSERPTKLRLPHPDDGAKSGMTLGQSFRDVVLGGGGYIVKDVKFTVNHTVEPMEKGFTKFNEKLHEISQNIKKRNKDKRAKDDSSILTSSPTRKVIRGIDDPLLNGSMSDSGFSNGRGRKNRKKAENSSGSGGESSSDQSYGGYMTHGRRWLIKE